MDVSELGSNCTLVELKLLKTTGKRDPVTVLIVP